MAPGSLRKPPRRKSEITSSDSDNDGNADDNNNVGGVGNDADNNKPE